MTECVSHVSGGDGGCDSWCEADGGSLFLGQKGAILKPLGDEFGNPAMVARSKDRPGGGTSHKIARSRSIGR
jgi:hypothetical protein